jgi:hypothetical protein
MSTEPTITVSVARKINLGNYESADYFVSLSGIPAGTTAEQMKPLLDTGRVAWEQVRAALVEQIKRGRKPE